MTRFCRNFISRTGGGDNDIEVLESLKLWRTRGWETTGKTYKIKAFSKIDLGNHEQIKRTIHIKLGVGLGFFLPDSAKTQFEAGQPWEVTRDRAPSTVTTFTCRGTQRTVQFASPGVANSR